MYKLYFTILFFLVCSVIPTIGQNKKTGFVDYEVIKGKLPETFTLNQQLEADKQTLHQKIEDKKKNLNQREASYLALLERKDSTSRQNLDQPFKDLYEQHKLLQEENRNGLMQIQLKEKTTQTAIDEKIKRAIQEVAIERGYGSILSLKEAYYIDEKDNLTQAVLLKLGISGK